MVSDLLKNSQYEEKNTKPRVTGVGGVFLKAESTETLKKWYADHLGFVTDQYGATFTTKNTVPPHEINYLQWSLFKKDSDYFAPSEKDCMINYRVENLILLVENLKIAGVTILDEIAEFDYGKFIHILDPEQNKIELWEPVDQIFTDLENEAV
ncbi:VOC family protein [Putridiphycobacter roseus]|uniref:VOC family protein n=1 Tax=Putridiphycobacter roseus TaxID=2219161 RepID=A0A2W1N774_9FLAO|nr:VOC family protein [Putridiphycobacter roseus]